jgi:hypothetical protein
MTAKGSDAGAPMFQCPVDWCTATADVHDVNPAIGEHALYVLEDGRYGDVGVHQTAEATADGEIVTLPAVAFVDLYKVPSYTTGDVRILARAFEMVASIADAINAGQWNAR